MRRIEAAVMLALLASCAVKTTSDALCRGDENCPADEHCQLSGQDTGRCVACVPDPRCVDNAGTTCSADGAAVVTCKRNEGSCWYRSEVNCASRGLSCGAPALGGALDCLCPVNSEAVLYVDPVQGASSPHATGVKDPPECRYRTLTEALALAQAKAGQTVAAKVIAIGATGSGTPVVFPASAETLPIEVPPGVSLETEGAVSGSPATGTYVMDFDAAAGPALKLHPGSRIAGWFVRNISTSPGVGPAVSTDCSTDGEITLDGLSIEALSEGKLAAERGIELNGVCKASFTAVTIAHTLGDGVVVAGGAQLTATGLNIATGDNVVTGGGGGGGAARTGGNGVTVVGPSTSLALHGGRIENNGKAGIEVVSGGILSVDQGASVSGNGTSGISIQASSATLTGTSDSPIAVADNLSAGVLYCNGETAECGNDASAAFQASFIKADRNADGVQIDNEAGAAVGVASSSFSDNVGAGLRVDRSSQLTQGGNSTLVDHCKFNGGTNGIWLSGTGSGITWVTVQRSDFSGTLDTAFLAKLPGAGYSGVTMLDNSIVGNGVGTGPQAPILRGTAKRPVGGIFFWSGVPSLVFQGNKVMKNKGDQLFVSSTDTSKPWRFDGPSDCSRRNVFACYASGQGIIAEGKASVYVGYAQWPGDPPSQGTDFMTFGNASISLSSPSTPTATSVCGVIEDSCN